VRLKQVHDDKHRLTPEWRRLYWPEREAMEADREAHRVAYRLVAEELLPAVAPGEWLWTQHGFSWRWSYGCDLNSDCNMVSSLHTPFFDRPQYFRRRGAKGPFTWKIGMVCGEPYGFAGAGGPKPLTVPGIIPMRGLDAIAHHDLSPWAPGGTVLFLVGRALDLGAAERLGFSICARGAARTIV
jgi:hypothetical protein